jgi:hypothetical protein
MSAELNQRAAGVFQSERLGLIGPEKGFSIPYTARVPRIYCKIQGQAYKKHDREMISKKGAREAK